MPVDGRLLRKLEAFKQRLEKTIEAHRQTEARRGPRSSLLYDPREVDPLLQRWSALYTELTTADAELADVPVPSLTKPSSDFASAFDGRGGYLSDDIARLQRDIDEAWLLVTHPSKQLGQVSIDREGIFLAGQPFDAMLAVSSIIRGATKSIFVIDAYIDEQTLDLLTLKDPAVTAQILTSTKGLKPAHVVHAKAFVGQYGATLEIRTGSTFHDRFLIIDDAEFFHFGTSINRFTGVKNTFMFSRIEEPSVVSDLRKACSAGWAAATIVPL